MIHLMNLVEGKRQYGCVMAQIEERAAKKIVEFNYRMIGEDVLYTTESGFGRETDPHITVKYGLINTYTEEQMQKFLEGVKPFNIQIKGLSLFENENFDVVKFDIESPELYKLNEKFSYLPNHDEHPIYHPHMTLAYVKHGYGKKYIKEASKHPNIPVSRIVYSNMGTKSYFDLKRDRLTRRDYDAEIAALDKEWERLDGMGNKELEQAKLADQMNALRKEKAKWEKLYKAAL